MPSPKALLEGYGLSKGVTIDGYVIDSATASHEQLERYKRYQYHITLTFHNTGNGNLSKLQTLLGTKISKKKIINSDYGNPYRVSFHSPFDTKDHGDKVTAKLVATSERVYN